MFMFTRNGWVRVSLVEPGIGVKYPEASEIARVLAVRGLRALVIELPQRMNGGATISYDDLLSTRKIAVAQGVHMHMDGARLWEV